MKIMFVTLLVSLNLNQDFNFNTNDKEIVGVFRGITDDFLFSFENENGDMFYFDDIDYDVDVNLYSKESIGKRYKISWSEEKLEVEEGLEDESDIIVKIIMELEELD